MAEDRVQARIYFEGRGQDARIIQLDGREGLSELFDVTVDFEADDPNEDLDELIWTGASVVFDAGPNGRRAIHGVVEESAYVGERRGMHIYRVRLRPRLHGLRYRVRSRIFQDKSVKEIVAQVLEESGVPTESFEWKLESDPEKREYVTQYRESELSFVLRLLEQEGIFFWFAHSELDHVLRFGDDKSVHDPIEGNTALPFRAGQAGIECVKDLVLSSRVVVDSHLSRDWNWETPDQPINAEQQGDDPSGFRRYEYPGGFAKADSGKKHAEHRLSEQKLRFFELEGLSSCVRLVPGHTFGVVDALPDALNMGYLVRSVRHRYFAAAQGEERGWTYTSRFIAMREEAEFRPPRLTARPRISGKEIAVVTGPSGEEIHCDEHGRVKVRFYWDREGPLDDKSSVWMRVEQSHVSGSLMIPRVGWEVEVGFEHGDPDRPLVLSRFYNREVMPPYQLPGDLSRTAWSSSTSPGGEGTNELRFTDEPGAEEWFLHAQRDFAMKAGHDHTEKVQKNSHEETGKNRRYHVTKDEVVSVKMNQAINVAGNAQYTVGKAHTVTVGAIDDWGVGANYDRRCDGSMTETIGAAHLVMAMGVGEAIAGNCLRTVGAALLAVGAGGSLSVSGGSSSATVAGSAVEVTNGTKSTTAGGTVVITSGKSEEQSGGSKSTTSGGDLSTKSGGPMMEECGGDYAYSAKSISLNAPGGVELGAGSALKLAGSTLEIDGSGFGASGGPKVTLKGSVDYLGGPSGAGGGNLPSASSDESGVRRHPDPALPTDHAPDGSGGDATVKMLSDAGLSPHAIADVKSYMKSGQAKKPQDVIDRALLHLPDPTQTGEGALGEFSPGVNAMVSQSPTLSAQVGQITEDGWQVRRTDGTPTHADHGAQTIFIDGTESQIEQAQGISHEVGHALQPQEMELYTRDPSLPREQFVEHNARAHSRKEGYATLNNALAREEISAAGGPDIGISGNEAATYDVIAGQHRAGELTTDDAVDQIGGVFLERETQGDGQTYRDAYGESFGNMYDGHHARRSS